MPEYFALGMTARQAQLVRALVAEAAPDCGDCADFLKSIDRQLALLNGETVLPERSGCSNC